MPAKMTKRENKVQQNDRTANARITTSFPKSVFSSIDMKLNINHTYVSTAPTLLGLLSCISSIQIIANGRDTKVNIPPWCLYWINMLGNAVTPMSNVNTGTAGPYDSYCFLRIPFANPGAVAPEESPLDGRLLDSLVLDVNWGGALMGTETINSGYLQFETNYYSQVPAEIKPASHEFAYVNGNLDVAGDIRIDVPVKSQNQYSRIWIFTKNSSAVLANDQISNIKLETDSFVYFDTSEEFTQAKNMLDFSVGSAANTPVVGVYCLNLTNWGYMNQRIDARVLNELVLTLTSAVVNGSYYVVFEKMIYG